MNIQPEEYLADVSAQPIYEAWLKKEGSAHKANYGRRLPVRRIREAGLLDQWRLANDIAKWLTGHCENRKITICVTDASTANAWALVEGPLLDESVIIITSKALLELQGLNRLVAAGALGLSKSMGDHPILARALGSRPLDERTAIAVAQLVMTSAMLFLLFHEAAHIVRGHLRAAAVDEGQEPVRDSAIEDSSLPQLTAVSSRDLSDRNFYSRTVEFDADVQALYWTRLYLDHVDPTLIGDELGANSQDVFRLILASTDGRRWISLAAALCFHLAINGRASALVGLKDATHPSRHERVELAVMSDAAIAFHYKDEPLFLHECISFAIRMICMDASTDQPVLTEVAQQIKGVKDGDFSKSLALAASWLGATLDETSANMVYENRLMLMESMRLLEPNLARRGRPSCKLPPLEWWRTE